MGKEDYIYVAGHTGMVGSAICRELRKKNYKNIVLANHSDYSNFWMPYDAHSRNSGESLGNLM